MLYSFLLTGSRGGFIGFAVVMFLLARRKVGTIIGTVVLVVALVGLLNFAPDYTVERMKTASPYEGTGADRIWIWYQGWQMFLSNPIVGVGMNNFHNINRPSTVVAIPTIMRRDPPLNFLTVKAAIGTDTIAPKIKEGDRLQSTV